MSKTSFLRQKFKINICLKFVKHLYKGSYFVVSFHLTFLIYLPVHDFGVIKLINCEIKVHKKYKLGAKVF